MATTPVPPAPAPSKWDIFLSIGQIVLGVLGSLIPGAAVAFDAGEAALQIAQKAAAAYQLHTGQPMDPTLIQPEAPIE